MARAAGVAVEAECIRTGRNRSSNVLRARQAADLYSNAIGQR
jgi:hypothetical protein